MSRGCEAWHKITGMRGAVQGRGGVRRGAGCDARGAGRGAVRERKSIPRRMGRLPGVSGVRGEGGERRTGGGAGPRCTCGHAHAAGEDSRGGVGPCCTDRPTLEGKGVAGGGDHPRCTDGHTPAGSAGERGPGGGQRRYPSTLHRRAPSSLQESLERRLSPRRRLWKIGSCSSLNSQKEPIPIQSPPSAARKILFRALVRERTLLKVG
jgi:hypothetical protein